MVLRTNKNYMDRSTMMDKHSLKSRARLVGRGLRMLVTLGVLTLLSSCELLPLRPQSETDAMEQPLPDAPGTVNQRMLRAFVEQGLSAEESGRGVIVYLTEFYFDFDRADIVDGARDKIRSIALEVNKEYARDRKLLIEGHTDSIGPKQYNLLLSRTRAESVQEELVYSRIPIDRINVYGFGEAAPIAPNKNPDGTDNPDGRARNRRVEFIILNPE